MMQARPGPQGGLGNVARPVVGVLWAIELALPDAGRPVEIVILISGPLLPPALPWLRSTSPQPAADSTAANTALAHQASSPLVRRITHPSPPPRSTTEAHLKHRHHRNLPYLNIRIGCRPWRPLRPPATRSSPS